MQWAIPLAFEEYYDHKPIKYSILKDIQRIKKKLPCTRVKKEINFSLLKFIINDDVMHIFLLLQVHVHYIFICKTSLLIYLAKEKIM